MPDPTADVSFDRALELLEIGEQDLEQLLVDGALRGYRSGHDIIFRRQDIADYLTRRQAPAAGVGAPPPQAAPQPPAPEPSQAQRGRSSRRDNIDSIKKAAMAGGSEKEGMWSLKRYAVEQGWVEGAPPPDAPPLQPAAPAGPAPPVAAPAEGEDLAAENEALRTRLNAAEEVLNDLQNRLEKVSQIGGQYEAAARELAQLRDERVELEAKIAAYEETESDAGGMGWAAPDPDQQVLVFRRENADLRGEMAVLKRKLEDQEREAEKLRSEREEANAKVAAANAAAASAAAASGADESERVAELQEQIEKLTEERDLLAVEAEVAHELKGEIERADELQEKLKTQREVIEAAQKGLVELEEERDGLSKKVGDLEESLASAEKGLEEARKAGERAKEMQSKLDEAEKRAAELEEGATSLSAVRDEMIHEIARRDEEMTKLRSQLERGEARAKELEQARAELEEAKSRVGDLEGEVEAVKVGASLKDQLLEQLKAEERDQAEIIGENAQLREKVAEVESRAKQAEARMQAIRSERDSLAAEVAKHDGAMEELRAQAAKATSLVGESGALKEELESARARLASLASIEPEVSALTSERDRLAGELEERGARVEELEKELRAREKEVESLRARAPGAPAEPEAGSVRAELESLRAEITRQMQELGQTRLKAAVGSTRRTRTAREVAGARRVQARPRSAPAPGERPDRLGRYEIGEEIRRSRVGTLYKGEVQPSGGEVEVLVLSPELTSNRHFVDRFWHEMRTIAELDEPALLGVMDVGETAGFHYIAYERVEGETLDAALRREGKVPVQRAAEVAASVLDALATVAKNKVVHADVKPENVILASDGRIRLAGLGLARGGEDDAVAFGEKGPDDRVVAVAHYGAPEQILGRARDAKSDLYSAGAVLFRMASGRAPIEASSVGEARALAEAGELAHPETLEELPENIRKSMGRLLAGNPDDRYRSAVDAAKALRKLKLD